MSEWQPISNAPRGVLILVYVQSGSQFVSMKDCKGQFPIWGARQDYGHLKTGFCNPSHWMALPAPPTP